MVNFILNFIQPFVDSTRSSIGFCFAIKVELVLDKGEQFRPEKALQQLIIEHTNASTADQ